MNSEQNKAMEEWIKANGGHSVEDVAQAFYWTYQMFNEIDLLTLKYMEQGVSTPITAAVLDVKERFGF